MSDVGDDAPLDVDPDSLHRFKKKYFSEFTWCSLCKEFIWGVHKKQGYKCTGPNSAPPSPRPLLSSSSPSSSNSSEFLFQM